MSYLICHMSYVESQNAYLLVYFGIVVSRTVKVLQTARFIIATLISLAGIPV